MQKKIRGSRKAGSDFLHLYFLDKYEVYCQIKNLRRMSLKFKSLLLADSYTVLFMTNPADDRGKNLTSSILKCRIMRKYVLKSVSLIQKYVLKNVNTIQKYVLKNVDALVTFSLFYLKL